MLFFLVFYESLHRAGKRAAQFVSSSLPALSPLCTRAVITSLLHCSYLDDLILCKPPAAYEEMRKVGCISLFINPQSPHFTLMDRGEDK